jgi:DNA-binding NarL/FixJ family response regulator
MHNIKIIIADDHTLFIHGLQLLLKEEKGIEIIDIAGNGKELLQVLEKNKPDLVLLDLNMPVMNGLEAGRYIKMKYPGIKMIILSTYSEEHLVEKAKQTGFNGYLLKNCSREELLQAINMVINNQTSFPYFEPNANTSFEEGDGFLKQFNLTKRELEILRYIKNGLTNQQIADKLFLSVYTVETHRKNIMHKLHLSNPASLIKFIVENNL